MSDRKKSIATIDWNGPSPGVAGGSRHPARQAGIFRQAPRYARILMRARGEQKFNATLRSRR